MKWKSTLLNAAGVGRDRKLALPQFPLNRVRLINMVAQ